MANDEDEKDPSLASSNDEDELDPKCPDVGCLRSLLLICGILALLSIRAFTFQHFDYGDKITEVWWEYVGKDIEIWKEEYSSGSIKVEYEYYNHPENNKLIKDGLYKSYYEDGGYKEVGTYKENVMDGEWIYYSKNGKETNRAY